jgi:hypothetical protein
MNMKLYSLLAIATEKKKDFASMLAEIQNLFISKKHKFEGKDKIYTPYDPESLDIAENEVVRVVTTVKNKLEYFEQFAIDAIDLAITIEEGNASTSADLWIEGISFGQYSPTSLLQLEKYINKLIALYEDIPTLDNSKEWYPDDATGEGYHKTDPLTQYRGIKVDKAFISVPEGKFPAQAERIKVTEQVGTYETVFRSGAVTSSAKARMLSRLNKVRDGVIEARCKANDIQVNESNIAKLIFDYVNGRDLT